MPRNVEDVEEKKELNRHLRKVAELLKAFGVPRRQGASFHR